MTNLRGTFRRKDDNDDEPPRNLPTKRRRQPTSAEPSDEKTRMTTSAEPSADKTETTNLRGTFRRRHKTDDAAVPPLNDTPQNHDNDVPPQKFHTSSNTVPLRNDGEPPRNLPRRRRRLTSAEPTSEELGWLK
eukprot:CAMPEP_0197196482 /NCGR_PEP_ID=MMETSP1423-20130617/32379_1 /TAXON_ID=476441 /ORGANISM="Pseudo-nitzschia heimii, Strain UNC1101" /LENGTH=132 /DNA_ID=CAMNT_0042650281 /DNA_START=487 /DNA_END=886 /DNA_ORIENTATION=+